MSMSRYIEVAVARCKLSGVDPQAYFADVLTKLVNLWPASRLDELMPWVWAAERFTDSLAAQPASPQLAQKNKPSYQCGQRAAYHLSGSGGRSDCQDDARFDGGLAPARPIGSRSRTRTRRQCRVSSGTDARAALGQTDLAGLGRCGRKQEAGDQRWHAQHALIPR
jgi:hypothetical protein